jgi:hypothetical protein
LEHPRNCPFPAAFSFIHEKQIVVGGEGVHVPFKKEGAVILAEAHHLFVKSRSLPAVLPVRKT